MPDFDDWIDAQLRNVPLPPDLLWRLAETGRSQNDATADVRLDAVLSNVSVAPNLEARLRGIPLKHRPKPGWMRWGLTASVFVLISAVGYVGLTGLPPKRGPLNAGKLTPGQSAAPAAKSVSRSRSIARARVTPARTDVAIQRPVSDASSDSDAPAPNEVARLPFSFEDAAAWSRSVQDALRERMKSRAALGAGGELDRLPALDSFEPPPPRGIMPPRVRGYDLLFQLKQGEHPFASPADHKALASSKMPFSFRTASYDLAVGTAGEGEPPSADEIRVEDFLAAQDYLLPAAPLNGLAMHTAAVASPFRDPGLHLLQLVVKAGSKRSVAHPPTRLVTLVDVSARMAGGGRWEATLRALAKIADDMGPADRLTLIGFAAQPSLLAANATGAELRVLVASETLPKPAGLADFAEAARLAGQTARTAPGNETRRVVFITAGREIHGESTWEKARESLAQLTAERVPWRIVRLSADDGLRQLEDIAGEAQGAVIAAASASEIRAALWEQLAGQSSTVAEAASLKLTFNPKVVTGYRLLGHASATITGEAGDPLEVDLRAGQTATAMYELWIKPGGEQIAAAELTWRDPAGARQRRLAQWIRRAQISESFSQAPAWFQQGVIAAKTAEALRGSYYASSARSLDQIHDLARQVDPRAAEQPDFQALVRLLEQVQRLR